MTYSSELITNIIVYNWCKHCVCIHGSGTEYASGSTSTTTQTTTCDFGTSGTSIPPSSSGNPGKQIKLTDIQCASFISWLSGTLISYP